MTATERLRELLDERGVRYAFERVLEGTLFHVSTDGEPYYFILVRDDDAGIEMWSQYLTPEQAIEATLGGRECRDEWDEYPGLFNCSECGYDNFNTYAASVRSFNYCPNCGRKVSGSQLQTV